MRISVSSSHAATDLASSVLPTPAGPSTRIGFSMLLGEIDRGRDLPAGDVADRGEPRGDGVDGCDRQRGVHERGSLPRDGLKRYC